MVVVGLAGWNVSPAKASVIKFSIEDWINSRTLDLAVPRDKASPGLWDLLAKVHDGAVVKADFPSAPGSSGVGDLSFIWNADGTAGPDNDGSLAMISDPRDNRAFSGFERWTGRIRAKRRAEEDRERLRRELEEAKHTGFLLLGDGGAPAWHGVTPSGRQCHHRHRSPEAASECAARLQQQES
jgi:hypothetical protein